MSAPVASEGASSPSPEPLLFREVAQEAGLTYRWRIAGKRPLNILQTIGNGCAFLDYDRDGNLDILLVGTPPALYRGDGKGNFTDLSVESGVGALKGHFLGCAVGDYDADGFPDIYLSAYRGGALLKNEGGKSYQEVTRVAGLGPQPWGTSCAFSDVDRDGKLDLYIGNYVQFGPETDPQLCDNSGIKSACGPRFYKPEKSRLFRNLGRGRFGDSTEAWKAHEVEGKALGVAFADPDGSGREALAIANDEMPGDLLANQGMGFKNIGKESGTAYDDSGNVHGGMGIDWGDYDNDGRFDLFVGTFQNEAKNIYRNEGSGLFTDMSASLGMAPAAPFVTFGAKWLDIDNDGWLDLALANGHVQDNIAEIDKTTTYRQPLFLMRNSEGRAFENVSARLDVAARRPIVGRGVATGDYDNDGRIDLLVVDSEGAPLLLHNEVKDAGHYLTITLEGKTSNRSGIGAVVTVKGGGKTITRRCGTDGSYLSASDVRIHFGLGEAPRAESITVRWPSGKKSEQRNIPTDRALTIREE